MRKLDITVNPETGGYRIISVVTGTSDATGHGEMVSSATAVCSTYQQIPARIKALVTVAQEHMQPSGGGA